MARQDAAERRQTSNGTAVEPSSAELALIKRNTVDVVAARIRQLIESRELVLPADYSVENALKSAWLILQDLKDKHDRPVLTVCTPASIANSLLDMAVQALNPAKKQCYFIAYGSQLVCQRSYFGDMALVKRVLPQSDIWYGVVYEGDEFEYDIERGRKVIRKHHQRVENMRPDRILAAYCVIEPGDGRPAYTEIMTWAQIQQSWRQSRQYKPEDGKVTPHITFPDQMALRTVIRRACKYIINTSSDDYLLLHHIDRADRLAAEAEMEAAMAEDANGPVIDVAADHFVEPEFEPASDAAAKEPASNGETKAAAPSADAKAEPQPEPGPVGVQASFLEGPGF